MKNIYKYKETKVTTNDIGSGSGEFPLEGF